MATKKDLVEAYSFSRRRLVTAFVSGAPGGREVEPSRPGRTIVGGVALAVLLAAGAAIAGVFAPRTPDDWAETGLIVSKETGAAYVILPQPEGEEAPDEVELRPVINTTSAKLILGADSAPTLISQDTIDDQRIGEDIGILGAPASVPTPSLLLNSGWAACTADGRGIKVAVAESPDVAATSGAGVLVRSEGDYFVVAQSAPEGDEPGGAYVYELPPQRTEEGPLTDTLLEDIGLDARVGATEVPRDWLALFPTGAALDLESLQLDSFGEPPSVAPPEEAADALVGDVLETDAGARYLVTDEGPVRLGEFAAALYVNLAQPGDREVTRHPVSTAPPQTRAEDEFLEETRWPDTLVEALPTDPCAQLTAEQGEAPVAQLVSPGESVTARALEPGEKDAVVEPGRGAYVLSGGWSGAASGALPFLVDSKGRANPLVGSGAAAQLGYAEVEVPVVPDAWVELFACGVNLSEEAALQPPVGATDEDEATCGA